MTLKEMPKVGDKVRYIGGDFNYSVTVGKVYEVYSVERDEVSFVDDDNDVHNKSFISGLYFDRFELVTETHDALQTTYGEQAPATYEVADEGTPVEASPTVIELLANISRRLYEVEQTLKEQAYEINELYRSLAEQAVSR
ncbi:hypothetical protein [Psychrobacillus sp. OK032]|uniref:hypothetical protein n=1 Tax=Psychrobacillus sp. OK032 TaxID=1884358 RepID=UPI0008D5F041|nr:hypothetical protein [Psychrobacillus sp. OK032]SER87750.1 hypothetical protein SAMN05518872_102456 [Psychrobacillus sp. OK032]